MDMSRKILGVAVLAALCGAVAFGQSQQLKAQAQREGYVLTPAAQTQVAVAPAGNADGREGLFPVQYDLEDGEEEGIYWPWGQKWPGIALGVKAGTTGLGGELTFGINKWLNLRGGYNWFTTDAHLKIDDVKYDADIDLDTFDLLVDLHPFSGVFRITGGVYWHQDGTAELEATPKRAWTKIGDHRYQPATIGTISGRADIKNDCVPYVGIGWGNSVEDDAALTLSLDIGVMFQSYDVSPLYATGAGMTSSDGTFREDLQKERKNIQDDLDDWRIYPVVALSLAYHF
jgi:hypothetical protein